MTEIDIIIPTYNATAFLGKTLLSAVNQNVAAEIKVIVVDDYSTDGTQALVRDFVSEHPNVQLIEHTENLGPAAARNTGLRLGSAPFIAFLDHDDVWNLDKLKIQLDTFNGNEEPAYSVTMQRLELFGLDSETLPKWLKPELLNRDLDGFLPSSLMLTRKTLAVVGEFDESLLYGVDDLAWFAKARNLGIICHRVDIPLVTRKVHSENLSKNLKSQKEMLSAIRNHIRPMA
jgi:glycosyltransferase involved in cell wall biosynthesis